DRGTGTDLDGRDQARVRADERVVADDGAMLVRAVVVACDRAGADIDAFADGGIADVAQMIDLAAVGNPALLRLDEVADLDLARELGTRAHPRKRPDLAAFAGRDVLQHAVRVHDRAIAERRI